MTARNYLLYIFLLIGLITIGCPASDKWTKIADFKGGTRVYAVAFTLNEKGYVGLGYNYDTGIRYKDFWEYDPATNKWARIADFGGEAREHARCFTINSYAYVGTGIQTNSGKAYQDFWKYNSSTNSWAKHADFKGGKRFSSTSFSLNGKGYFIGGYTEGYDPTKDVWKYDPSSNSWSRKGDFPGGDDESGMSFIINDKVYFAPSYLGGDNFYEYNPTNDTWVFLGGLYNQKGIGITLDQKRGFFFKNREFWEYIP